MPQAGGGMAGAEQGPGQRLCRSPPCPRRAPGAVPGAGTGSMGAWPALAPPLTPIPTPRRASGPAPPLRGTSGGSGGLLPFPGAGPGRSGGTGAGHGGAGAGAEPERGARGDQARGFRGRSAPGPAGELPAGGPKAGGRRPRGAARPRSGGGAGPRPRCPSAGRAELRGCALGGGGALTAAAVVGDSAAALLCGRGRSAAVWPGAPGGCELVPGRVSHGAWCVG